MKHSLSGYAVAREGVDDTIIAVHKSKIGEFNEHLNKHSTSIQFTKEIEEDGKIAFLECFLTASTVRTLTRTEGTKLFATQTTV